MSVKRWWYGSYETLSRGEREFLYVLGGWVVALAIFVGALLTGCEQKPVEWRGIPPGVHATCDYSGESFHTLTCVGDDAKVYLCIEQTLSTGNTIVKQCAPLASPLPPHEMPPSNPPPSDSPPTVTM